MAFFVKKVPGRTVFHQGSEFLYFGGTSYLGLQNLPEFEALFLKNIREYGMSHGASRKSNVRLLVYEKAEKYMAQWAGAEAAMLVSSGYMAGQLLRDHFDEEAYAVFHMPEAHAALSRKRDRMYTSLRELKNDLENHLLKNPVQSPVLFLDTVTFSEENYPGFDFLKTLNLGKIMLVADDSHGIGIIGENGAGALPKLKALGAKELLVCASLSKGPTIQAGVVLANSDRVAALKESAPYAGGSPASPASMATLLEAGTIYRKQRKKLAENMDLFLTLVNNLSYFRRIEGHPAFSFDDPELTIFLEENRILVTSFNYQNTENGMLSRIVISAGHTREDIEKVAGIINNFPGKKTQDIA